MCTHVGSPRNVSLAYALVDVLILLPTFFRTDGCMISGSADLSSYVVIVVIRIEAGIGRMPCTLGAEYTVYSMPDVHGRLMLGILVERLHILNFLCAST